MSIFQSLRTVSLLCVALLAYCSCASSARAEASATSSCLLQRTAQIKAGPHAEAAHLPHAFANSSGDARLHKAQARAVAMSQALRWSLDIFGDVKENVIRKHWGQPQAPAVETSSWTRGDTVVLGTTVVLMMLFDYFVLQRLGLVGLRHHLILTAFWVLVGMMCNAAVWLYKGRMAGIEWLSGYVLEWLLSLDNLFVFHLIFRLYSTPKEVMHKALFFGILGAVISRLCFFSVVSSLLRFISAFRFIFGVFLIWSGVQAARGDEDEDHCVSDTAPIRFLRRCLGDRLLDTYDKENASIVVWKEEKLHFTLLLPVIACIEVTDIVFALDSVSAKAAQIPDYWICCSSSVVAMFGLRAMFFIVKDLVDYFDLLKYGLCFILAFIGIELMISDFVQLPPQVVLVVILAVFIVSIAGSAVRQKDGQGAGPARSSQEGQAAADLLGAVPAEKAA